LRAASLRGRFQVPDLARREPGSLFLDFPNSGDDNDESARALEELRLIRER
jgi:hypothetical protein